MEKPTAHSRWNLIILGYAAALSLSVAVFWLAAQSAKAPPETAFELAELDAMTAGQIAAGSAEVVPAMLLVIYEAFGETNEAGIYDRLATVAAGPALEALYLERMGAMVGGGLPQGDMGETGQTIHEMQIVAISAAAQGDGVSVDARWQVIGSVGHGDHEHVRGNIYAAALDLSPVQGGWRMTGFDLQDVDRTLAGTTVPGEDG